MKTAAVVIDGYKLPVFEKHLEAAGYKYEKNIGPAPMTFTLKVEYNWAHELQPVIEAANREATFRN